MTLAKFFQIASICQSFIAFISVEKIVNPSGFSQLIDFLVWSSRHLIFNNAKIFSIGENSGVYIGIYI